MHAMAAGAEGLRFSTPKEIAEWICQHCHREAGPRHAGVSFLLGSGFSRSAGIPLASEIVRDFLQTHPMLKNKPTPGPNENAYAYYMRQLPAVERAKIIHQCIDKSLDPQSKRTRINWAHLLLASMVDAGYVRHILTTNFDPLCIDALALMGQPVRVFDLMASDFFLGGALEGGSIVYLHGQSSGALLASSNGELQRVRRHLSGVFLEALRESMLVVVGYSGECDPVLEELDAHFPQFRHNL